MYNLHSRLLIGFLLLIFLDSNSFEYLASQFTERRFHYDEKTINTFNGIRFKRKKNK